jgi:hypothetical protein
VPTHWINEEGAENPTIRRKWRTSIVSANRVIPQLEERQATSSINGVRLKGEAFTRAETGEARAGVERAIEPALRLAPLLVVPYLRVPIKS